MTTNEEWLAEYGEAPSHPNSIGVAVGRIEVLPVDQWRDELAKIDSEVDRAIIRGDLLTIYELRKVDDQHKKVDVNKT